MRYILSLAIAILIVSVTYLHVGAVENYYQAQASEQKIWNQQLENKAQLKKTIKHLEENFNYKLMEESFLRQHKQNTQQTKLDKIEQYAINIPKMIEDKKFTLEQKLKMVNVEILNDSVGSTGSGVTLKYEGKYYILSAGHMVSNPTDTLFLRENGNIICELEIIKCEFTPDKIGLEDSLDLLLLRPKNKELTPEYYVELSDNEPLTATEVYVVGNPLGIEDNMSDGRVQAYSGNYMFHTAMTYFGNSGGGIYTLEGKLIGIVSFLSGEQPNEDIPPYMIYGAVRLDEIKKFLKDIK
jgi:S1-C subfamily serine protease